MAPTLAPTKAPTMAPTFAPTKAPTMAPTMAPTFAPTMAPTMAPGAPLGAHCEHNSDCVSGVCANNFESLFSGHYDTCISNSLPKGTRCFNLPASCASKSCTWNYSLAYYSCN